MKSFLFAAMLVSSVALSAPHGKVKSKMKFGAATVTNPITYRVDTSSANLGTTFPSTPQLTGFPTAIAMIQANNASTSEIEINCSTTSVPASDTGNGIYIPGSSSYASPESPPVVLPFGKSCWLRSKSGSAITTGVIELVAWGY